MDARTLELTSEGPIADVELGRDRAEGETRCIPLGGRSHLDVRHLARVPPPVDTSALQVADHGRAVDAVLPSESVDGLAVDVPGHEFADLISSQPALLLAEARDRRNVLVLGGSADHLLKSGPQFLFRE